MNFYLCSGTSRAEDMEIYKSMLELHGHKVTSRWHGMERPRLELDSSELAERAKLDLEDIDACDVLIAFDSIGTNRGGRHYEAGYAHGTNKQVWLCGRLEHAFHTLSDRRYEKFLQLLDDVRDRP